MKEAVEWRVNIMSVLHVTGRSKRRIEAAEPCLYL
jgi:hypothetical protein